MYEELSGQMLSIISFTQYDLMKYHFHLCFVVSEFSTYSKSKLYEETIEKIYKDSFNTSMPKNPFTFREKSIFENLFPQKAC